MNCLIVFATETGTAQEVAEDVAERSAAPCVNICNFDVCSLVSESRVVVFVVSTTGQGEMPSSMRVPFWSFLLQKRLSSSSLSALRFMVCGLGDSAYPQFNFAAKKLHARLGQLGAVALSSPLLLEPSTLGRGVRTLCKLLNATHEPPLLPPFPKEVEQDKRENSSFVDDDSWLPPLVKIVQRESLSDGVTQVTLDIGCEPGDVLEVWPPADDAPTLPFKRLAGRPIREASVDTLLAALQLDGQRRVFVMGKSWSGARLHDLLHNVLDIRGAPSRNLVRAAAFYSTKPAEQREVLLELARNYWSESTRDYLFAELRSVCEMLLEFAPRFPSAMHFCFLLRPVLPRQYSIAGASPIASVLLVSSAQAAAPSGRLRFGRCSAALAAPEVGALRARVVRGRLNKSVLQGPAVLVAAGTGLAAVSSLAGPLHLLALGCRTAPLAPTMLSLFSKVWLTLSQPTTAPALIPDGVIELCVESRYIWQALLTRAASIWDRMQQGHTFVIAGSVSSGFARDTLAALHVIVRREAGMEEKQAKEYVDKMEKQGKLIFDVWG